MEEKKCIPLYLTLKQIFLNSFANALKFLKKNKITLEIGPFSKRNTVENS